MNKNLLLALLGISIGGITFGLLTPVTVVLLEKSKAPGFITGLITTINYVPFVLLSSAISRLIEKKGIKTILIWGFVFLTVGSAGHLFWQNYYLLFAVRILTGIGSTCIFIATEILINVVSDDSNRGKNIGLYAVLLSIGIALGTMLVWTVEIKEWLPFVIGAIVMGIAFLLEIIYLECDHDFSSESEKDNFPVSKMPLISIFSPFLYGIFESSIVVAIPIFGLRSNFNISEVSYFLTSFVAGGIILLFLISKLSDKISKYNLIVYISFALALLFLTPTITHNIVALLAVFFLIGGIVPSYYTVGLNYTMANVNKENLAQSNGYFIMFYGSGTLFGPMLGAMLVDINKDLGYWIFSSFACFMFFLLFNYRKIN